MTTVAWDGETLAADTLATSDGFVAGHDVKIHRLGRLLIGGAGSAAAYEKFRDWVASGMSGDCPLVKDIGNLFVIEPGGRTTMWCDDGPFRVSTRKWALGSGDNLAMGAMEAGADAAGAVRAAMAWDTRTGGDVTVLRCH